MRGLVISPHLDDAILSVGGTFRGGIIATVLAGLPPEWTWPSPFDNASGFSSSRAAVEARQAEDRAACVEVDAAPLHLRYLDGQYGLPQEEEWIADALAELFWMHRQIAVPVGLAHPDHRLVARACRTALAAVGRTKFVVYADLPSAHLWPGHVPGAVRGWERAGYTMEPVTWAVSLAAKARAVEQYASQRRFPELAFENLTEERGWIARRTD